MTRSVVLLLAVSGALASACSSGLEAASDRSSGPSPPASVRGSAPASAEERVPVPSGFPVPPGAVPMPLPDDDQRVIGLWQGDLLGPAAYDFYVRALPAAGYRIVATYPGGAAAVVRFSLPDGAIWQLVMRAGPKDTLRIELRPDALY